MSPQDSLDLSRRATAIYESQLRAKLETASPERFVAIEPESGEYFLGDTLSAAVQAARTAYPDRLPFALRIGHTATVELGVVLP